MSIYGERHPDGSISKWPDTDIYGATYRRPANMHNLTDTIFVVLPTAFNRPEDLERLMPPSKQSRKSAKAEESEESDE